MIKQKEQDKIVEIATKIETLKLSDITYQINNEALVNRTRNVKEIKTQLDGDLTTMKDIFKIQTKTLNKLTGNLEEKKRENVGLRIALDKKVRDKETFVADEKHSLFQKLKETQEFQKNKKELERKYIKIILGLYIVKKYFEIKYSFFLSSNEMALNDSDEYFLFKSRSYTIVDKVQPEFFKRKFTSSTVGTPDIKCAKVGINYLQEKFSNLSFQNDEIHNLVSQLLNKKSFYQQYILTFSTKVQIK